MGRMDGKITLVTGSTKGIGRAVAQALAAEGARVVVHGRASPTPRRPRPSSGPTGSAPIWVTGAPWRGSISRIGATVGPVDVLVNNAGMSRGAITRLTDAEWDRMLAVNLTGPMAAIRAVVPGMKRSGGGSIVNTISNAATDKIPALSAYAAAKGGLLGLTRTLSAELSRFNIRVNAISPLAITELLSETLPEDLAREFAARGTASVESIGEATLFLASDMSRDITGLVLDVHGYREADRVAGDGGHPGDRADGVADRGERVSARRQGGKHPVMTDRNREAARPDRPRRWIRRRRRASGCAGTRPIGGPCPSWNPPIPTGAGKPVNRSTSSKSGRGARNEFDPLGRQQPDPVEFAPLATIAKKRATDRAFAIPPAAGTLACWTTGDVVDLRAEVDRGRTPRVRASVACVGPGIGGFCSGATRPSSPVGTPKKKLSMPSGVQISSCTNCANARPFGSVRRTTSPISQPNVYDRYVLRSPDRTAARVRRAG